MLDRSEISSRTTPPAGDLGVNVRRNGSGVVVAVCGELDSYAAPRLRGALMSATLKCDVVIDASELSFIDSSGLGVLVGARRHLAERGHTLAIHNVPPPIFRVMEITGLVDLLTVEPDGAR